MASLGPVFEKSGRLIGSRRVLGSCGDPVPGPDDPPDLLWISNWSLGVPMNNCPPFDAGPEALDQWIQGLRKRGVRHAAPALILALEALRQTQMPVQQRLGLLRLLKSPLLKTCTGLPKPLTARRRPGGNQGLSLEQRLYRLMFQNLDQALHQIDRSQFLPDGQEVHEHDWVIRNLFRFFQRQLRYAALWETPMPENAWRDLHELFVDLSMRRRPAEEVVSVSVSLAEAIDPDPDYKQLLLFGLAATVNASWARSGAVMEGLARWARETIMEEPEAMQGGMNLILVEISEDAPPHVQPGSLDRIFRGWVLVPPSDFRSGLEEKIKGTGPRKLF